MFRASSCPSSGATTTPVAAPGLPTVIRDTVLQIYKTVSLMTIGKPEAATAVVAPDDGHEDPRNMLSCI